MYKLVDAAHNKKTRKKLENENNRLRDSIELNNQELTQLEEKLNIKIENLKNKNFY